MKFGAFFSRIFDSPSTTLLFLFGLSTLAYFSIVFLLVTLRDGLGSALKGFLIIYSAVDGQSLSIHLYTPVFYFLFFTFVLVPLYLKKSLFYLILIWAANEWIFNTSYSLMYPYNFTLIDHTINFIYLGMLGLGAIIVILLFRKNFTFSYFTLAFPIFFLIWALEGMPLMLPGERFAPYLISNPKNFLWELFYQITLCISFIASIKS